jgi:MoxR-like ATPase
MNVPTQLAARDEYETDAGLPPAGSRVWISGFPRHEHDESARLPGLHGLKPSAFANGADAMLVPGPPSAEALAEAERTGRRLLVPDDLRTAVRSGRRRTAIEVTDEAVRILDVTLPRRPAGDRRVPPADQFAHLCLASLFMKAARSVAIAASAGLPCALEGETAVAQSTAVLWVAWLCRQGAVRLNLKGQSDAGELVGRFVPNGHAAEPGDHQPPAAWRFWEGIVPDAMRHGHWVVLDELNLAEPQVLERLNPVLESPPTLVLAEHRGERFGPDGDVPVAESFRIFATMNPAEYAGRSVLSPAFRDRWSLWNHLEAPGEPEFRAILERLVHGTQPEFTLDGVLWRAADANPILPCLAAEPGIDGLLDAIASFHSAVAAASGNGHAAREAVELVYMQRVQPGPNREAVRSALRTVGLA